MDTSHHRTEGHFGACAQNARAQSSQSKITEDSPTPPESTLPWSSCIPACFRSARSRFNLIDFALLYAPAHKNAAQKYLLIIIGYKALCVLFCVFLRLLMLKIKGFTSSFDLFPHLATTWHRAPGQQSEQVRLFSFPEAAFGSDHGSSPARHP
jgi:hypothetical protein